MISRSGFWISRMWSHSCGFRSRPGSSHIIRAGGGVSLGIGLSITAWMDYDTAIRSHDSTRAASCSLRSTSRMAWIIRSALCGTSRMLDDLSRSVCGAFILLWSIYQITIFICLTDSRMFRSISSCGLNDIAILICLWLCR